MATKYTDEQFLKAVKESFSVAQTLRELGLSATGGNYLNFKIKIEKMGLDISHFTGQAHLKGKNHKWNTNKRLLEEVMVKNSDYSRDRLKKRLIKNGMLKEICAICGQLTEWKGKKLVLVLDHINGVNNDHRLENLRLLCPNCNSQTKTFCGRNSKIKNKKYFCKDCGKRITNESKSGYCIKCVKKYSKKDKNPICIKCGKQRHGYAKSKLCRECYNLTKNRKVVDRPSPEILVEDIRELGYCGTGRKYNVSDNAIRKWMK